MDLENIVVDITQRNYNTIQTIQYDVDSRYVNVKIVSSGKNVDLTNYMVSIACKKPDGKIVFNETEMVEPKQGLIKFLISEQITTALGEVVCELKIYGKNSSVLTTQYFTINVAKPIADKSIQSTNEFRQLTIAMNDYNAWVDKVKDKYDSLEEEYAEELSGVKSGLEETNTQLSELANRGTTVEVLERVTREEINRQIADGTIANLTIEDNSLTTEKYKRESITTSKLSNRLKDGVLSEVALSSADVSSKYLDAIYEPTNKEIKLLNTVSIGNFRAIKLSPNIKKIKFKATNSRNYLAIFNGDNYISVSVSVDMDTLIVGRGEDNVSFSGIQSITKDMINFGDEIEFSVDETSFLVRLDRHDGNGMKEYFYYQFSGNETLKGYYEDLTIGFLYGGSSAQASRLSVCSDLEVYTYSNDAISQLKEKSEVLEADIYKADYKFKTSDMTNNSKYKLLYKDNILKFENLTESVYERNVVFNGRHSFYFTATNNIYWIILGEKDGIYTVAGLGENHTGYSFTRQIALVDENNRELTEVYRNNGLVENKLVIGNKYKVENTVDYFTVYACDTETGIYEEWYTINKSQYPDANFSSIDLYTGFYVGLSGHENTDKHIIASDIHYGLGINARLAKVEETLSTQEFNSNKKQAIVIVAGQSNAVGYDESPVSRLFNGRVEPRVNQLGLHTNNLKIISLTHCAENFQDMRNFTNPSNPTLQGTKGIHLPLGKLLLKDLPNDYNICFIPCAYGGTGFTTTASYGSFDETTLKPSSGSLRWGVDSAYYKAMKARLKYLLDMNEDNIFLGVVWIQGEHDSGNASGHYTAFQEMTNDFFDYFNQNGYGERVKGGVFDKNCWFNVETVSYWYGVGQCQQIWDNYRAWNESTYIEIPRDTDSNAVNGTGSTTSNRPAHFGNDAYTTVIAPRVYEKFKNQI